jgi:hypothetical protein
VERGLGQQNLSFITGIYPSDSIGAIAYYVVHRLWYEFSIASPLEWLGNDLMEFTV